MPMLRSSSTPRSLVSGRPKHIKIEIFLGQGPRENETRKWRRWQNGEITDRIAYAAHKLKMGNLTDMLAPCRRTGWSSAPSSQFLLRNSHDNDKTIATVQPLETSARARVSPWISRSRVDNSVNPARRRPIEPLHDWFPGAPRQRRIGDCNGPDTPLLRGAVISRVSRRDWPRIRAPLRAGSTPLSTLDREIQGDTLVRSLVAKSRSLLVASWCH